MAGLGKRAQGSQARSLPAGPPWSRDARTQRPGHPVVCELLAGAGGPWSSSPCHGGAVHYLTALSIHRWDFAKLPGAARVARGLQGWFGSHQLPGMSHIFPR